MKCTFTSNCKKYTNYFTHLNVGLAMFLKVTFKLL